MNNRLVGGGGLLNDPMSCEETHRRGKWNRFFAVVLIVTVMGLTVISPGPTRADDLASGTDNSDDTGIQVGSWLLTIPYCAAKSAFAVAGSVVGGLGYAFSGGDSKAAESVWTTSVYGTYIIRPAHLRGEEPIHFLGKADDGQGEPVPHAIGTASVPSESAKK